MGCPLRPLWGSIHGALSAQMVGVWEGLGCGGPWNGGRAHRGAEQVSTTCDIHMAVQVSKGGRDGVCAGLFCSVELWRCGIVVTSATPDSMCTAATPVNETKVMEIADAMLELGLDRLGYRYVVVDGTGGCDVGGAGR